MRFPQQPTFNWFRSLNWAIVSGPSVSKDGLWRKNAVCSSVQMTNACSSGRCGSTKSRITHTLSGLEIRHSKTKSCSKLECRITQKIMILQLLVSQIPFPVGDVSVPNPWHFNEIKVEIINSIYLFPVKQINSYRLIIQKWPPRSSSSKSILDKNCLFHNSTREGFQTSKSPISSWSSASALHVSFQ